MMKYTISLTYIVIAVLWIVFSDALVDRVFADSATRLAVHSTKGVGFVLVTGCVLFLMLHRYSNRQRHILWQLTGQEEGFRQLFTHNPQPMWIYDLTTLRFLEVNDSAIDKYGYTRPEFLAMTIAEIRPHEDVVRLILDLKQPRTQLQSSGEWRHKLKSGEVIDVEIASHTIVYEGQSAVMVIVADISAKKQAQRDLEEIESRLENVLNGVDEVVRIMDAATYQVTYISPAVEKVYGRQPQEFYQDSELILNTIHPDDRSLVRQQRIDRLAAGGWELEFRIVRPDGQIRWIHDRSRVIFDVQGSPLRIEGITTDVTERKHIQEEQQKNQALQQALHQEARMSKLRHRFTSLMSHEFRNPMAAIFSGLEMLERYNNRFSPEQRLTHIQKGKTHITRMVGLLDDILSLMYTENIGPEMKRETLDIAGLLHEIADDMQPRLSASHTFALMIPPQPVAFEGDEKLLRQAVENLLANAIKYSPGGGEIRLSLTCSPEAIQVQISDCGIGIPAGELPELFDVFHRASNVGSIKGTGLGLAMVKEVVQLHEGRIEVSSEIGKGTTMCLYLPAAAPAG